MLNEEAEARNKYDLAERTAIFGENVIKFMKEIKETTITRPLISQLIRSATSIGANYMEADCAESRKDFVHKIGIARKESKETAYWLRILATTVPGHQGKCEQLSGEATEFTRIFSAIARTGKLNLSKNI